MLKFQSSTEDFPPEDVGPPEDVSQLSPNDIGAEEIVAKQKRSCIMPGCNYSAPNGLFRWTTKEYLKKKWEKICGLQNVSENAKICMSHFHPDHIMKRNQERNRLRMGAVPTRNLPKLKVNVTIICCNDELSWMMS